MGLSKTKYIDDYESCARTYATLSLYHKKAPPSDVTKLLGIDPSRVSIKTEIKPTGWFYSSKDRVDSRDFRRHITYILCSLENKKKTLDELRKNDWKIVIHLYWESSEGNGGPILDSAFMKYVSEFKIDIHFDIWFSET